MTKYYSEEKNAQVIISLLKAHGIRKVIVSPGTTNMAFSGSIQNDDYFEVYSSVDERSAAYMACGLAAESNEPVVLSCTGATASRNYMPGLTEAFYRKLPVLAITSLQNTAKVGHHVAQMLDRSVLPNDVAKLSVELPIVKDEEDLWDCEIKVNKAILELSRHGGGPVHINLPTLYSRNYNVKELPQYRVINRITPHDNFPILPQGRIAVFIGSHKVFTTEETLVIDNFCATNDAVVFCDHTSGYYGQYRVGYSLVAFQRQFSHDSKKPDLLIHIGEVSGDYYSLGITGKMVWRVNPDGELRDTYRKLRYVFEMEESDFFTSYTDTTKEVKDHNYNDCLNILNDVRGKLPEIPFSNIWIAQELSLKLTSNSSIHFGILNSLRSWNFFDITKGVTSFSNVGGFGIDGCLSSLIGASLANREKLYYAVVGDLAFFYDLNVVGNRHVGNNVRILLVNNGKGTEFRNYDHPGASFGDDADRYISAGGHFGKKSSQLIKHYSEDLGYNYLSANNKDEFITNIDEFVNDHITDKPTVFEVFTDSEDESSALEAYSSILVDTSHKRKAAVKSVIGKTGINIINKIRK